VLLVCRTGGAADAIEGNRARRRRLGHRADGAQGGHSGEGADRHIVACLTRKR
jgi:hypothetical protein